MRRPLFFAAYLGFFCLSSLHCELQRHPLPAPTTVVKEEEGENRDKRDAWLETMHRAAEGVNWRQIEYQTQYKRHLEKAGLVRSREDCGTQVLANGRVMGHWIEQGSINQAGSVFDTEYNPIRDEIWLISAGGTLWRGPRDGSNWQVVNEDLKFTPGLLKFVPRPNGRRLLAFIERIPHYSDDDGLSWKAANGIAYTSRDGNFYKPVVINDAAHSIYFLARSNYTAPIILYKSSDQGETYQAIKTFSSSDPSDYTLCNPHHSTELLLMEKASNGYAQIFRVEAETNNLVPLNDGQTKLENAPANLVAWAAKDKTMLYIYVQNRQAITVQISEDNGKNWQTKGFLETAPWDVGLYLPPSDSSTLFMGEVNCYRSRNKGGTWQKVNNWTEYYDNVIGKLHADIMHFAEFNDADGHPFLLVSHHGGLTISNNYLESQQNISLNGLNVSQYYSVRTDPNNPNYVYAGSQDQGFQRSANVTENGKTAFEQVVSGDYGHIVFSNNGQSLWTVYPGGSVSYYPTAQTGTSSAEFEVKSNDESVWLPPLTASPNPAENIIYMAGGNKNGGNGSYVIKLEAKFGGIISTQQNFDFKAESGGGTLSAIAISTVNPNRWLAATTNGRFFRSENAGQNWQQTLNFIPEGHYLYGQTIYPSKLNEQIVYLGGSGYSNPPIYKSVNGGKSFVAMSDGLPPTLVFEITANADESLLFAATEAGPYVFVTEDNRWYDLSGQCAPAQTYWSAEFIESQQLIRFGTYGRGIWDFKLEATTPTTNPLAAPDLVRIFPNPSTGIVNIDLTDFSKNPVQIQMWDASGKLMQRLDSNANASINMNLSHLQKGIYFIQIADGAKAITKRILLQ